MADHDVDPAADLVLRYLRLAEARERGAASELLDPNVEIVFPGGRTFRTLDEQFASSSGRFRSVRKTVDRVDTAVDGDEVVVYVFGTLAGVALNGTGFAGVRFLDRFTVRDGLIVDQMVWNDLAETGVVVSAAPSVHVDEVEETT